MAYTVKKLSELSRVTVSTLHFYEEIGLLKNKPIMIPNPTDVVIDPESSRLVVVLRKVLRAKSF